MVDLESIIFTFGLKFKAYLGLDFSWFRIPLGFKIDKWLIFLLGWESWVDNCPFEGLLNSILILCKFLEFYEVFSFIIIYIFGI